MGRFSPHSPCVRNQPWCGRAVKVAIKARKAALRKYKQAKRHGSSVVLTSLWQEYLRLRDCAQKTVTQARKEWERNILSDLKSGNTKQFWKLVKNLNSSSFQIQEVLTQEGKILSEDREIEQYLTSFWMLQNRETRVMGPLASPPVVQDFHFEPISLLEVEAACKFLRCGKAVGMDDIPGEFLKYGGSPLHKALCCVFNHILKENEIPFDWSQQTAALIYKNGDKRDPKNYRPISLISNVSKVFLFILRQRISSFVEGQGILSELQCGFREDRRTSDNLFVLSHCIEYVRDGRKEPLYLAFLDITKAYDTVWRPQLWQCLQTYNIPPAYVRVIKSLYETSKTKLKFGCWSSQLVPAEMGVRQGCPLSPLLFSLYLNRLAEGLSLSGRGVRLGQLCLPGLLYADDIVLMETSQSGLQGLLDKCHSFMSEARLQLNSTKCKVMVFLPSGVSQISETDFYLEGTKLEVVDNYTYLGIEFSNQKKIFHTHNQKLLAKASRLKGLTLHTAFYVGSRASCGRQVWKSIAVPALTYGNDILTSFDSNRLDVIQRAVGRCLLKAPHFTANCAIQGELGWSSFVAREVKSKLRFFARLTHMEDHRIPKLVWDNLSAEGFYSSWLFEISKLISVTGILTGDERPEGLAEAYRDIEQKVDTFFTQSWLDERARKSSLRFYASKEGISWDGVYDNSWGSVLLFRARTDTLPLAAILQRWGQGNGQCALCGAHETLEHFLLECSSFTLLRKSWSSALLEKGFSLSGVAAVDIPVLLGLSGKNSGDKLFLANLAKSFLGELWKIRCPSAGHSSQPSSGFGGTPLPAVLDLPLPELAFVAETLSFARSDSPHF